MARSKKTATPEAFVVTAAEAPLTVHQAGANELALATTQQDATVRAVATQLGYQLPADCTDPDLIQRDISANMRRSVEACLEVGRGLAVLKAACEHGQFIARLDVLGIEVRVAQKFMASAVKFSNAATSPLLKAAGGQSKLFEMLLLDDEQIEELALTGHTGELHLDDVATMSVKELRQAVREARETAEARARLLSEKDERINKLTEAGTKKRVKALPPADVGEEIRKEAAALAAQAEVGVRALRAGLLALAEHAELHGIPHDDFMAGLLCQVELACRQLRGEFDIKAAPDGEEMPDWLRGPAPDLDQPAAGRA